MIRYHNQAGKPFWDKSFSVLRNADIGGLNRIFEAYNFTAEQLEDIVLHHIPQETEFVRIHLLQWILEHENVKTNVLEFLVNTPSVRPTIAELWPFPLIVEHPNVSSELLHTMLMIRMEYNTKLVTEDLVIGIATQPAINEEDLMVLLAHEDSLVRSAAFSNVKTPVRMLREAAFSENTPYDVLSVISKHANTPADALVHLLTRIKTNVVFSHPNLPFNVLLERGRNRNGRLSTSVVCLNIMFGSRYEELVSYVRLQFGEEYLMLPRRWLAHTLGFSADAISQTGL